MSEADITQRVPLRPDTIAAINERGDWRLLLDQIKRMTPQQAAVHIANEYGSESREVQDDLIRLAKGKAVPTSVPKGKMYAVLWVCGATWSQIATLGGVKRSTAINVATAQIPTALRQRHRDGRSNCNTNISNEVVSALRDIYLDIAAKEPYYVIETSVEQQAILVLRTHRINEGYAEEERNSAYPEVSNIVPLPTAD